MKECEESNWIIPFFRKLVANEDEWLTWRSTRLTLGKETQRPFNRGLVGLLDVLEKSDSKHGAPIT
jgi:hypothetical protein